MRVAFVTPYLPSPANSGGRIRMHQLARALAQRAEVELFSCGGVRERRENASRDELRCYTRVHVRNSDWGVVLPWFSPARVRKACPARLARDLERSHAHARFDVVVVEHSYASATASRLRDVPMVLDEHNVESAYYDAYYGASRAGPLMRRQVGLLRAWERTAWQSAAAVTCVTDDDARSIGEVARAVRVIPNGAEVEAIPWIAPSQRERDEVLFVGLMSHAPNVEAAVLLAREVMPRVWPTRPGARLVLCGRSPERAVRELASDRVEVTGTVPSVTPFLSRAAVYANALARGAGSSLKVVEALASGVTMVSTAAGVRGFPLVEGEHYLRAGNPEAMARAIVGVLASRASYDAMSAAGREIAHRYDWRDLGSRFCDVVAAVARGESLA